MERSCFNCRSYPVCIARIGIDESIKYVRINIDTDDAPKEYTDLFITLGSCCLSYEKKQPSNTQE